ncbi:MAG TPA: hypothetical protein VJ228_01290 [Candidatus Acidoferrales bacterium]|nr:hypothetical protein [Candidatus Acidoferrales bacterium]
MADWRQIQARIRKAKNSADAKAKLSELYQRTHDAMVAWELGVVEEKAERNEDAVKWFTIAAERFRRADWKKKAEEALTRLGAPLPAPGAKPSAEPNLPTQHADESASSPASAHSHDPGEAQARLALGETRSEQVSDEGETGATASFGVESHEAAGTADAGDATGKKKRRRGRRGGRGRRRKGAPAPGLPSQAFTNAGSVSAAPSAAAQSRAQAPRTQSPSPAPRAEPFEPAPAASAAQHESDRSARSSKAEVEPSAPMLPSERTAHGRAGDPALASRMSKLESMLRRLVASPLHRLDELESAPAGPGVFLLSDSDQITSYYVEACQTLRVGLGNLARGSGRSVTKVARGGRPAFDSGLKTKLAEHLGIGEAKVSQYLKDHCVVRWIQLDDDAPHLAHFAIGVLRTPLNLD